LRTGSTAGPVVSTALPVQLQDTSLTPAPIVVPPTPIPDPPPGPAGYSISRVVSGLTATFTITTTNFPNGALYWTNGGTTIPSDFTDGVNFGTIGISNSSATIVRTLRSDYQSVTDKTVLFRVHTGSTSGPVVATDPLGAIVISSNATPPEAPPFEYTVTPTSAVAFIGATSATTQAQFTINCTSGSGIVNVRKLFSDPTTATSSVDGGQNFNLSNPGVTYANVSIDCTGPFGANPAASYVYNFAVDSLPTTKAFFYTQRRYDETVSCSSGSIDPESGQFVCVVTITGGFAGGTVTVSPADNFTIPPGFGPFTLNSSGGGVYNVPISSPGIYPVKFTFPSTNERTAIVTVNAAGPPPDPPPDGGPGGDP